MKKCKECHLKCCAVRHIMDRSKIPHRAFSRSRSQVVGSHWVQLWCSGFNQSDGSLYEGVAVRLLCWLRVFRESTPSLGSLHFLFEGRSGLSVGDFISSGQFSYILFPPLFSDSQFTFGFSVHSFCLSIFLIESVGGCVLFPPPPFRHRGTCLLWTFCDFTQCFVGFPACDPCLSGFVFLGNVAQALE